jgi:hypothetical protein
MRHPDFKLNENLIFHHVKEGKFEYWYADDFYLDPTYVLDFIRWKDGYWDAYRSVKDLAFHNRHEIITPRIKHAYDFLCNQFNITYPETRLHELLITNVIKQIKDTPYQTKFDEIHKDRWLAATVFLNKGEYPGTVLVEPKPGIEIENWFWDDEKQRNEGWVDKDSFDHVIIEAKYNRCIFYKSIEVMHCWAPDQRWIREERVNQMFYLGK